MRKRAVLTALMLTLLVSCDGADDPSPSVAPTAPVTSTPTAPPTATPVPDPFALAREMDARSPEQLAERLRSTGDGRVLQAAYRQLVPTPEWRPEVLRRLDPDQRRVVEANVEAGERLRLLTAPKEQLPPWRIVAPPPAAELRKAYAEAEKTSGVGWEYLAAIHLVETRMGRIRGTSDAGAKGPMQFLPSTWERWGGGGDIEDPHDAIMAAARYLKASGAPGDMDGALFAYNHSDHYVRAVELYAQQMRSDPGAFTLYHQWDVYYRTTRGDALLYVGWPSR